MYDWAAFYAMIDELVDLLKSNNDLSTKMNNMSPTLLQNLVRHLDVYQSVGIAVTESRIQGCANPSLTAWTPTACHMWRSSEQAVVYQLTNSTSLVIYKRILWPISLGYFHPGHSRFYSAAKYKARVVHDLLFLHSDRSVCRGNWFINLTVSHTNLRAGFWVCLGIE